MSSRVSSGQAARGIRSVSSVTQAPSRTEPSVSVAWIQSSSWTRTRPSRTPWSMGNPMEKSQLAATMLSTNPWVAPAASARTRIGWVTRAGSSSEKWPVWYSSGSPDNAR
jgi:hypothetical protein